MTTPSSGEIRMSHVATEISAGYPLSLTDSRVRTLAGVPSGQISLSQLRGKSAALRATGNSASAFKDSRTGAGTVSCNPSVTNVQGGTAPYTYNWSFVTNPGGFAISTYTDWNTVISKAYGINTNGNYTAVLQCIVSDSSGKSVVVYPINATLQWSGNQ